MGNEFSKLSSGILSKALSRFSSKPAASLGSKAKAAIGLGGLAGAGALAHHYDMLLPSRVTSQLANEVVAPTSMPAAVKQIANEVGTTSAPNISAVEPASSVIEAATVPTTVNAAITPESNARQVLNAINSQPSNAAAETANSAASRPSTVTDEQLEGYNKRKNLLMGGTAEETGGIQADLNLLRSRVAKPGIFTDLYHGPFAEERTMYQSESYPERYLTSLINLRDEAAFLGDTKSIPEINRLIDGFSKSLDEGSRNYANSLETPITDGINSYTESLNPLIRPKQISDLGADTSYIKKILGYDSNPWGIGANSSNIPIDTEMGRLRVSTNPDTNFTYSLQSSNPIYGDPNELRPMDYSSYLKQLHNDVSTGKYIDSQGIGRFIDSSIDDATKYILDAGEVEKASHNWHNHTDGADFNTYKNHSDSLTRLLSEGKYTGRHNISSPAGSSSGFSPFPDMEEEALAKFNRNNYIDYASSRSDFPTKGSGLRFIPKDNNLTREYYKYLKDKSRDMDWFLTSGNNNYGTSGAIDPYIFDTNNKLYTHPTRIAPYATAKPADISGNSPALEYPSLSISNYGGTGEYLPGYKELGAPRYPLNNYRPAVKLPELRPLEGK